MIILEAKTISKSFDGSLALNKVSIKFNRGMITGLFGLNGSGKTTLLNILTGLQSFDEGIVNVDFIEIDNIHALDVPIYKVSAYGDSEKPLGLIELVEINSTDLPKYNIVRSFQNVRLFEQMTVLENLLPILYPRKLSEIFFIKNKQKFLSKVQEVLSFMGLWDRRNELAKNLTYSERRLVDFCRVLLMNAKIVLLDEPFSGLEIEKVKIMTDVLQRLRTEGKAVAIVESQCKMVWDLCDYIYVLSAGEVLKEGRRDSPEVMHAMKQSYYGNRRV